MYQKFLSLLGFGSAACVTAAISPCVAEPQHQVDFLKRAVQTLVEDFFPRDAGHPENLARAADWIATQLAASGGRVERQRFAVAGRTYENVRAFWGPSEGARLVMGAHYDTAGELPGADDNASGVAVLLALAEKLKTSSLQKPIELVAYTLEEPPYFRSEAMGSAVHAKSLVEEKVQLRAMISLEMLGYFTDAPKSQEYPSVLLKPFFPSTGNFLAVVGKMGDGGLTQKIHGILAQDGRLPIESLRAPKWLKGVDFSDHLNYWNEGFSAVMLTDTAFMRNKRYHTPDDTPETLDYTRMSYVVDAVYLVICGL